MVLLPDMSPFLRFAALACALVLSACGKQGEGERCDLNSGNLDCEVGLVCRSADQLSIQEETGWALCCPPDNGAPTVAACQAGAELPMDNDPLPAEPMPDAGVPPAGDGGV
jgi:hypothetical protein